MTSIVTPLSLEHQIYTVKNIQVMLDEDLAVLYQVKTKALNQAVKRNIDRFPEEFCFRLTKIEYNQLRSQSVTLSKKISRKYLPYAFTEQGVAMLSAVLTSKVAVQNSIQIMRAFIHMRKHIFEYSQLYSQYQSLGKRQQEFESITDKKFLEVFNALSAHRVTPKQQLFFDGEIFDAYHFVAKIIRSAKTSIDLVDNYINEEVLSLFTKCLKKVKITLYVKEIKPSLLTDINKYNAQYTTIVIKKLLLSHDRFLIIDQKTVYHFGASLKDLGKKWFAVTRLDQVGLQLLQKLYSTKEL